MLGGKQTLVCSRTVHSLTVVTHSAKADFCCYVLRTPAPKEMCYNALLNQIDETANFQQFEKMHEEQLPVPKHKLHNWTHFAGLYAAN